MLRHQEKNVYINELFLDRLDAAARKNNVSLNTFLNSIFMKYLESRVPEQLNVREKRLFPRKRVAIPAMIYEKMDQGDEDDFSSVTVSDISPCGIRLVLPLEMKVKTRLLKNNSEFEVIFPLSEEENCFHLKCRVEHIEKNEHIIRVGCSFVEGGNFSHEDLCAYIMQCKTSGNS